MKQTCTNAVALRKESVDRNTVSLSCLNPFWVALRKESVDRNTRTPLNTAGGKASLSARRAWIEMTAIRLTDARSASGVALRKESVDRNGNSLDCDVCYRSLSARRAWIEILSRGRNKPF